MLPRELWGAAAKEQEERREADPWEDILRSVRGIDCDGEERILSQRLLVEHLSIRKERQKHADLLRVGTAMRRLGWKGPKLLRASGDRGKGYWKPRAVTESPMRPG